MLKDEIVLVFDGFVPEDPAVNIRKRAKDMLANHKWSTDQIEYGDQEEPPITLPDSRWWRRWLAAVNAWISPEKSNRNRAWSISFALGLDNISDNRSDWRTDVQAIFSFLQEVQQETDSEFMVDIRFQSAQWYSDYIEHVDGTPIDISKVCERIIISSRCPPRKQ
jgi:hypothetical protein